MQSKWANRSLFLLLLSISIALNIYFRLNPLFLPQCYEFAKREVYEDLSEKTEEEILSLYPDLPNSAKFALVKQSFKSRLKREKRAVRERIRNKAEEYRQFWQDERGWTYLLEIDPYRSLRRIENFLETGRLGTKRIDGQEVDEWTVAPPELQIIKGRLHYYIGAYFFKCLNFFNKKIMLMESLALVPVIFSSFLIIMVFVISSFLDLSYFSRFLNSLCIGLSPQVIFRTSFGWFDTDIYNILLPLTLVVTVGYLFTDSKWRKKMVFLLLSGLLMGFYASIWIAWWYIFYIIVIGWMLYILNIFLMDKERYYINIKESILNLVLFILICSACVVFFSGPATLKDIYSIPALFLRFRDLSLDNFWPNPGFIVSELRRPSIPEFVDSVGGNIILFGGILGILFLFLKRGLSRLKRQGFLRLVLFIWLLFLLIAIRRGARFILMFSVPIGIGFGVFIEHLYYALIKKREMLFNLRGQGKRIYNLFVKAALGMSLIIPLNNARFVNLKPFVNDSWWNVLIRIKEDSPKDTVINTWWDNGDWFASISKRHVVNDAYFQYTPIPYWMARASLTNNERESIGILRMLNSGSYHAFDELSRYIPDKLTCLKILNKAILLKQNLGYNLLMSYIKDEMALDRIVKLLYGPPPPAYFVLDNLMLFKLSSVAFLGKWDFKKLDIWQKKKSLNKEAFIGYLISRYKYTKDKAHKIYEQLLIMDETQVLDWISPKKSFTILESLNRQDISKDTECLFFDNGLIIDMRKKEAFFMDNTSGKWLLLKHLIYINSETIEKTTNLNAEVDLTVLLIPQDGNYRSIVLDEELAGSMFARLFFMNGKGLNHFKQILHEKKEGFCELYVYKIDWE